MTQMDLHTDLAASPAGPGAYPDEAVSWSRMFVAESPQVLERIITAPTGGEFTLSSGEAVTTEGDIIQAGQVVGAIERNAGSVDVVSPHTGFLMGLLALPGERVRPQQPLAWVRVMA